MDSPGASQNNDNLERERPLIAEVCRMTWLVFGPAGIIFAGATIWKQPPWTYTYTDWLYWGIAGAVVISRFVEIRFFQGRTAEDKPATMADWSRHTVKFLLFATTVWFLAQWSQA